MATTATLPADPQLAGNVWCDACQQSLLASRAATHLASKKHAEAAASKPAPAKKPKKQQAEQAEAPEARAEKPRKKAEPKDSPARARTSKVASIEAPARSLREDPDKPGNAYCGICKVSLVPSKAEGHLETARHQQNAKKMLTAAMNSLDLDD